VSGGGSLRIGQVAELTGTTPRTIRYYEEIGLLPPGREREPGAHRLYEQADVERLQEVLRLKRLLGLSLEELRELSAEEAARAARLREWHSGVEDPVRRREILEEGIGYVERQLQLLRRRREELDGLEQELITKRRRLRTRLREAVGAGRGAQRGTPGS
jgi:DNA-binding transcriptional MerR regulator